MNNIEITQEFLNNAKNTIITKTILYNKILEKLNSMKIEKKLKYFTTKVPYLSWEWNSVLSKTEVQKQMAQDNLAPLNEDFFVQNYHFSHILLFVKNNDKIIPMIVNRNRQIQELDVRRNNIKLFVEAYKKYVINGINPLERTRFEKDIKNEIVNTFGTFKYNVNVLKNGKIRFDETKQLIENKQGVYFSSNTVIITPKCYTINTHRDITNYWSRNRNLSDVDNFLGKNILSTNSKEDFIKILKKTVVEETEKSLTNLSDSLF